MEQISKRLMNWASILEPNTRAQAERTASMPFIYPHLALMPDCHLGKGATVGSVIPTLGAIIPAAVGVDIGCGMMALRTQFTGDDVKHRGNLAALRESIEQAIPLSAGKYNTGIRESHTESCIAALEKRDGADSAEQIAPNWRLQLGSLGSGNHFIEVSLDEESYVWLFLHSGSRGVGNKLATRHVKIAQQQCPRRWISLLGCLGLPRGRRARVLGLPARSALGAAFRTAQPRGDDAPRPGLRRVVDRCGISGARSGQLPSQLHRAGNPLR